jgi:hypothetical protein
MVTDGLGGGTVRIDVMRFLRDTAQAAGDDYATAFKLLGMVVFVAEAGAEPLLSGRLVSVSTFNRWVDTLRTAGWGDLLGDVRLRQALREYMNQRVGGLPMERARTAVMEAVSRMVADPEALSPQAVGRQASDAVKGLAGGREAEPSALDGVAAGGSLGEATAPKERESGGRVCRGSG